jgi:bifunctional ADP-heptose synthase (sugar kinase/adenylyltransferase)
LDTRTKIVSEAEARQRLAGQSAHWLSGYFDPLLAEHVRMLRERAAPDRRLVVEITNPPRPLLAARARAELVAALGMVDYVVIADGARHSDATPDATPDAPADAGITERFIQHVLHRHRPEGRG